MSETVGLKLPTKQSLRLQVKPPSRDPCTLPLCTGFRKWSTETTGVPSPSRTMSLKAQVPLEFTICRPDDSTARSTIVEGVSHPMNTSIRTSSFSIRKKWVTHSLPGEPRLMSTRKHVQTKEGVKDVAAFSKDIPEAAETSPDHTTAYLSPTSTLSSPNSGERVTLGNPNPPSPAEPPVSVPPPEGHHITNVGAGTQDTSRSSIGPPTTSKDEVNAPPTAVTSSTSLSLRCRMCNAPPTVVTRPTVTVCGHLFCYEYVLRIPRITTAGLTLHQVHYTMRDDNFQMSLLRQRPLAVLFIQTRSPSAVLAI